MRIFNWLAGLTDALAGRPRKRRSYFLSDSEQFESRAMLSAIFVTTPVDASDVLVGDGQALTIDGETSLRSAVQEANANPGFDIIELPPGLFSLDLLETIHNDASGGDLDVTDDLSIRGSGPQSTVIDAAVIDQLFELSNGAALDLHDLTIRIPDLANVVNDVSGLAPLDNVALIEHDVTTDPDATLPDEDVGSEVAIPIRAFAPLSQNSRQVELVQALAQPQQLDSWEAFSKATLASHLNSVRLDATIGIGTRSNGLVAWKPHDRSDVANNNPDKSPNQAIGGNRLSTKMNPGDSPAQRRKDVVNSLFEKPSDEKQRVQPAGVERVETISPEQRSTKDAKDKLDPTPALLPQVDGLGPNLKPNAIFPIEPVDRPAPPPLPESRDDHTSIQARRPLRRSTAIAVGVLVAVVSPKSWPRVFKKLSKRNRQQPQESH